MKLAHLFPILSLIFDKTKFSSWVSSWTWFTFCLSIRSPQTLRANSFRCGSQLLGLGQISKHQRVLDSRMTFLICQSFWTLVIWFLFDIQSIFLASNWILWKCHWEVLYTSPGSSGHADQGFKAPSFVDRTFFAWNFRFLISFVLMQIYPSSKIH